MSRCADGCLLYGVYAFNIEGSSPEESGGFHGAAEGVISGGCD